MITRTYEIREELPDILSYIGPRERLVFFDIETTGLRAGRAELYLIGALYYRDGSAELCQWFSGSLSDELKLLTEFSGLLNRIREETSQTPILVSYNGDGFDIPFLSSLLKGYGEADFIKKCLSFDLFKHFKGLKRILGLSDMKLKTLERFLSMGREDKYSGGELISVYERYRELADGDEARERLLSLLLLHNKEDISGLPRVAELLAYKLLFEEEPELLSAELIEVGEDKVLDLRFRLRYQLPAEFSYEDQVYCVSASGSEPKLLNITAELFEGSLCYFFADYKNYYYLPLEDRAIHKSVGEFVEKSARQRAKRENCYERRSGLFLPEPDNVFAPVYYKSYGAEPKYASFHEELLSDREKLTAYAMSIMSYIKAKLTAKKQADVV